MVRIIGIRVVDRIKESGHTQEVLSKHSAIIKSRLGFHELNEDVCSREGYILINLLDDEEKVKELMDDLSKIYGIEIRHMHLGPEADKPYPIPVDAVVAVVGLVISNRDELIMGVQKILSVYGCSIRTRLGINEDEHGENTGLILLELIGEHEQMNSLVDRLSKVEGVSMGIISFN